MSEIWSLGSKRDTGRILTRKKRLVNVRKGAENLLTFFILKAWDSLKELILSVPFLYQSFRTIFLIRRDGQMLKIKIFVTFVKSHQNLD